MSCTSSFFGTTASLSFEGFGSGGTEVSPPSAWNFAMRVLLYDQPSENFFFSLLFLGRVEGSIWQWEWENDGRAYSHDDLRIGIAAVYCGHGLRSGEKRVPCLTTHRCEEVFPCEGAGFGSHYPCITRCPSHLRSQCLHNREQDGFH